MRSFDAERKFTLLKLYADGLVVSSAKMRKIRKIRKRLRGIEFYPILIR